MKNTILLLLLLPFGLRGQVEKNHTDNTGRKQGFWQKEYPNGKPVYQGYFRDDKPVGEWKRFYESGALKVLLVYRAGSDTADAKLFDSNGKTVAEGSYTGEKKTGIWSHFSEGRKIAEERFLDGIKTGICRKYYFTGQLLEEAEWKDNLLNGHYQTYFISGQPYLECMYQKGKRHGLFFSYHKTGGVEVEAYYQNDLPEKAWKYYDETGKIRYVLYYDRGCLMNPEVLRALDTRQLDELELQRSRFQDPEKYLENPEEYMMKKK